MIEKIYECLKLIIEKTDCLNTICYKCAENIETYHNFLMSVKKSQSSFDNYSMKIRKIKNHNNINRGHFTSYVREQVVEADYSFSFLNESNYMDKKETKQSSPFFSYFSPPNPTMFIKQSNESRKRLRYDSQNDNRDVKRKVEKPKHLSADIFESQSQDCDEVDFRRPLWKLTPDDGLIRRVRDKCFGRSD
ncbi:unnamed protein product [Leptidea sinapis]|uniref:ZAD domain-containing protein n=1 Tax=Leptidea sinapis TaxID=189913 RepID=A0A5E4R5Q7_9NEOP|nr:unnamed protein product [Leptidea sinapis]